MDSLYIVMPAYNEKDNIKEVVEKWYSILDDMDDNSRIVVADNGSADGTHEILLELQEKHPKVEILNTKSRYHGPKVIALYDYAIKQGIDYIFQTDSDGQTNPEDFKTFWEQRKEFDATFGKRTVREDGCFRLLVEKILCIILRIFFGIKVPDANAPYRLMKADIVKKYLYRFPFEYNLPNVMLTTYFVYYKEKIDFKEITFKKRRAGVNSINMLNIIRIGWNAIGDFWRFKRDM